MAVFVCERCGAPLPNSEDGNIVTCEYCGSQQSLPNKEDERVKNLFIRANELRRRNEFDKANGVYTAILDEAPECAAAYWGALLCEFGIEYVEDEKTGKRIPTCHRSSSTSLLENANYTLALQYADSSSHTLYTQEAKTLEQLRLDIATKVLQTAPVDIFICYKETGDDNQRTQDSVLAQRLYMRLEKEGWRCFFARETLKQHPGESYEPYIFSALHTAKVMLVVCTKREYLDATWVKNEWKRYLTLMQKESSIKRRIIPCYKELSIEELPEAFLPFEAVNLATVGAEEDLVLALKKSLQLNSSSGTSKSLIQRLDCAFIECSSENWDKAEKICDELLNEAPRNANVYLALLMAQMHCTDKTAFEHEILYSKKLIANRRFTHCLVQFAEGELKIWLEQCLQTRRVREEKEQEERRIREEKEREERRIQEEKEQEKRRIQEERRKLRVQFTREITERLNQWNTPHQMARLVQHAFHAGSSHFSALFVNASKKRCDSHVIRLKDGKSTCFTNCLQAQFMDRNCLRLVPDGRIINFKTKGLPACTSIATTNDCGYALGVDNYLYRIKPARWYSRKKCDVVFKNDNTQFKDLYAGPFGAVTIDMQGIAYLFPTTNQVHKWPHDIRMAAIGHDFIVGLGPFGELFSFGKEIIPPVWNEMGIVAIAAGDKHMLALTQEGQVLAAGDNNAKQCDVGDWKDCIGIVAASNYSVAIRSNGTLLSNHPHLRKASLPKYSEQTLKEILATQLQMIELKKEKARNGINICQQKQDRLIRRCKLQQSEVEKLKLAGIKKA